MLKIVFINHIQDLDNTGVTSANNPIMTLTFVDYSVKINTLTLILFWKDTYEKSNIKYIQYVAKYIEEY
jgi:hypothetical protein